MMRGINVGGKKSHKNDFFAGIIRKFRVCLYKNIYTKLAMLFFQHDKSSTRQLGLIYQKKGNEKLWF